MTEKKKILIVTYYWPPSGGSGVQRWLKFVKYLPSFGWEPWVFTPENPAFNVEDESLLRDIPPEAEVIRFPIWEPNRLYYRLGRMLGKKVDTPADQISTTKTSFFQKISSWIRGNLFIPDARVFWVKPSVTFLEGTIAQNRIEYVITTGPPHSMHLIGLELKRRIPSLQWLADFRDPWSEWNLLDTLSLTTFARFRHIRLEQKVLRTADAVLTIGPYFVERFRQLGARHVELLTNGYDEDDFALMQRKRTVYFTVRHTGIVDELRDPRPFFEAVVEAGRQHAALMACLKVEFIGHVNESLQKEVEGDKELCSIISFRKPVRHSELLDLYGETDVMLLVLGTNEQARGNLPGKFFEYLATGNPILAVGPVDGDVAHVLAETRAGRIFTRFDKKGMAEELLRCYERWKSGDAEPTGSKANYTRKNLTQKLVDVLESQRNSQAL